MERFFYSAFLFFDFKLFVEMVHYLAHFCQQDGDFTHFEFYRLHLLWRAIKFVGNSYDEQFWFGTFFYKYLNCRTPVLDSSDDGMGNETCHSIYCWMPGLVYFRDAAAAVLASDVSCQTFRGCEHDISSFYWG